MQKQIERLITRFGKLWLGLSAVLIITPWLLPVVNSCVGRSAIDSPWCALDRGPIASAIVLLGVFLALVFCKVKNVKRLDVHCVLQVVGLVALLGFHEVAPFIAGSIYAVLLTVLASMDAKGRKDLSASPLSVVLLLTVLFLISAAMDQDVFTKVAGGPALFAAYALSVFGVLWLNIWSNKHSIAIYLVLVPSFLIVIFGLVVYYSAWSFVNGF